MIRTKWKICSQCDQSVPGLWSKGKCKRCCQNNKTEELMKAGMTLISKKPSAKLRNEIGSNKAYYRAAISNNTNRNRGICKCDECGKEIPKPRGLNVCHIMSAGALKTAYHDPINHFILGKDIEPEECRCGVIFDDQDPRDMKIYRRSQEVKMILKRKYYTGE